MKNTPVTKGTPTDRRLEALEKHRAGTQFQPLDLTSPSVPVQLRIPKRVLEQVDARAAATGRPRSDLLREAVVQWLEQNG